MACSRIVPIDEVSRLRSFVLSIPLMSRYCLLVVMLLSLRANAQDEDLSNGLVFDGEPYLVVDPTDTRHLVAAWMGFTFGQPLGIKTRVSFDAGDTWSPVHVLPHFASTYHSADPSLAFDGAGHVFACYIDYRVSPDSGAVYVVKSLDGGLTWDTGSEVIGMYANANKRPIDRPWLTIDPTNGHHYVTTKPAPWVLPPNRATVALSRYHELPDGQFHPCSDGCYGDGRQW
jgi:hypothetical protein